MENKTMKEDEKHQGNEGDPLDDFFKNALRDYQQGPPPGTWAKISRKLLYRELLSFNFTNVSATFRISGLTGLAILSIFLFFYLKGSDESVITAKSTPQEPTTNPAKSVSPALMAESTVITSTSTSTATMQQKSFTGQKQSKTRQPLMASAATKSEFSSVYHEEVSSSGMNEAYEYNFSRISNRILPEIPAQSQPVISTLPDFVIPKPSSTMFWSAGFSLSPEMTDHNTGEATSGKEFSWWSNLDLTMHVSRFTLATGISYGYSTTEAQYRVNYRSNDSIGYFTSIISFYVDPSNPNNIIFNTKNTAVFDSIDHIADDRARSRYTYLRIPVMVGFDLLQTNKFNINLHAGPAITFLVGKKEAEPYIDYPNARIIRIDGNEPSRINTSWQVWTGLRMDYRLTPALSVFAEPSFRYYLDTRYINNEIPVTNPWSCGLGVGVLYNFGKKKN